MKRTILHVDMDAFYASVEQRDFPELRGRPVVVAGDRATRHGVVCAASYEARAFGIRAGMPTYQALHAAAGRGGIILRPSRMHRYADVSRQIHRIFETYTPDVESMGLDEAFLDVTACERLFGSGVEIGHKIQDRIRSEMGLNCTVGVSENKLLAKLGSDIGKPNGFKVMDGATFDESARTLPVSKLCGVGPSVETALLLLNIRTVADLRACPIDVLLRSFGRCSAYHLRDMAFGRDMSPVTVNVLPKSFGAERTFERDIGDGDELLRRLFLLTDSVAKTLREHRMQARTVHLKARYPDFQTLGYSQTLTTPTALTLDLRAAARALFEERLNRNGRALRLMGVSVSGLMPVGETYGELPFFANHDTERMEKLDQTLDSLQDKYGKTIIRFGPCCLKNR